MKEYTSSFWATGDDGSEYSIDVFTDIIDVGTFSDPIATVEGLKELRTSDGLAVNRNRKGVYQVVQTGVMLRSCAPEAP